MLVSNGYTDIARHMLYAHFDICLLPTSCSVQPFFTMQNDRGINVTKILAPNGFIDFKFGVWLYIDGAYVGSIFRCCLISNSCTSWVYLAQQCMQLHVLFMILLIFSEQDKTIISDVMSPKKSEEEVDTVVMDTKLKIIEILKVGIYI